MMRGLALSLIAIAFTASLLAQQPAAGRGAAPAPTLPPLFFREEWRQIDRPPNAPADFVPERGVTTAAVTNSSLELRLYDPNAKSVEAYDTIETVFLHGRPIPRAELSARRAVGSSAK